jgi:hypothetical protein
MSVDDIETKLNAEFDAWFAKVRALSVDTIEPSEEWSDLWFDGCSPEEALEEMEQEQRKESR